MTSKQADIALIVELLLTAITITLLVILFSGSVVAPAVLSARTDSAEANSMIELTNNYRTHLGLGSLTVDATLMTSAQAKADTICATSHWDHTDAHGAPFYQPIRALGYQYTAVGENLARYYSTESEAFTALVASPTHYANIVGDYLEMGVGFNQCNGANYTVIHYGKV